MLVSYLIDSQEHSEMPNTWLYSSVITLLAGGLLLLLGKGGFKSDIFRREGFAVVGIGWIIAGIFGALPFSLPPMSVPVWDSLFECYSGFTTTGATIFNDLNLLPRSMILWRGVMQWMGGMGIVVLFVALLGFLGVGGRSLFSSESSALTQDDLKPRIRSLSFSYFLIYCAWTLIGIIGLLIGGMSLFDAVCHSFAAISTGGFSPYNLSISEVDKTGIHLWLICIMLFGGIAFPMHYSMYVLRKYDAVKNNDETTLYVFLIFISTLLITLDLIFSGRQHGSTYQMTVSALFQVVSLMTTTGFSSVDYDQWPQMAKHLLIILMIVGGCAGSTAGGLKVGRVLLFFKASLREVNKIFRPHLISKLKMNGRVVDESIVQGIIFYVALYFVILVIGIVGLIMIEPKLDFETLMSSVIACYNNIGPGIGGVGATQNYSFFNPFAKIWLSLFMLLGRLEIFAILLLFMPSFWKRF